MPVDAQNKNASPHLIVVELNEFNPNYLSTMAPALGLTHLQTALSLKHATTSTADRVEHQGLDPWVQWVGVHCGKPSDEHGIRRLGATRNQVLPQLWNVVAERGYDWGAWGVMNAPRGNLVGCRFFMPDPWSFDEFACPDELNDLLALPRYVAKNYLEMDYRQMLKPALRLARFFAPPGHWPLLARISKQAVRAVLSKGASIHTFTTLLDYLSVLCFLKLRRDSLPNLSIIFLNHLAHLQHQFWRPDADPHPEMKLGLQLCNVMLGLLLGDRQRGEAFLLMNGLRQENVAGAGFYVYRQRNPQQAIEAIGVKGGRVEQCMTHDAMILFGDSKDAEGGCELLDRCRLSDGTKAFYVERQRADQVFYQLAFEHKIAPGTRLVCGGYSQPFDEIFQLVCERTGAHVSRGDVFYDGINLPQQMMNHEIFHCVLQHFPDRGFSYDQLRIPAFMSTTVSRHSRTVLLPYRTTCLQKSQS